MIEVVVIGRNESASVDNMMESLPKNWKIYYVADRCTDNTLGKLGKYENVRPIDTSLMGLKGRQTSFCRNLGLSYTNPESDVLFLDGDRYIVAGKLEEALNNNYDITLLPLVDDYRLNGFFRFSENYGKLHSGFNSGGIFFKRSAIREVQNQPYMNGQFFPEFLQDEWGAEDSGLGDICYSLGLTAEITDKVRIKGPYSNTLIGSNVLRKRIDFRKNLKNIKW